MYVKTFLGCYLQSQPYSIIVVDWFVRQFTSADEHASNPGLGHRLQESGPLEVD